VSILRRLRVVGVGGDVLLAGAGRGGGAVVRRGAGRRGVAELFGFFRVGLEELGLEEGERKSRKGSDGEKVRERRWGEAYVLLQWGKHSQYTERTWERGMRENERRTEKVEKWTGK
jgi:hypothetical protein